MGTTRREAAMDDIHETITRLVTEEHELRASGDHSDEERERLRRLEEQLDQCWDLLRQRRAKREFGEDPAEAAARDAAVVQNYRA
jgi:ElaB/YqjD/DUF883 family membrane-anchored ribosome-binding protein